MDHALVKAYVRDSLEDEKKFLVYELALHARAEKVRREKNPNGALAQHLYILDTVRVFRERWRELIGR